MELIPKGPISKIYHTEHWGFNTLVLGVIIQLTAVTKPHASSGAHGWPLNLSQGGLFISTNFLSRKV